MSVLGYDREDEGKSQDAGQAAIERAGLKPTQAGMKWVNAKKNNSTTNFFETYYSDISGRTDATKGNLNKTDEENRTWYKALNELPNSTLPKTTAIYYRSQGKTITIVIPK